MKIFSKVLGIILIIGGVASMLTPAKTFLSLAWLIGFVLISTGITHIINYFSKKVDIDFSIWYLINGMLSILMGLFILGSAYAYILTEIIFIYMFSSWITVSGIIQVSDAFKQKKIGNKWKFMLVSALFTILIGIYGFFHPVLVILSVGLLIGLWMISVGTGLLTATIEEKNK